MTKQYLLDAIESQTEDINNHTAIRDDLFNQLTEYCPYKVGDIIPVQGYSHRGKMMWVTKVTASFDKWYKFNKYHISGIVLKKDGTESIYTADFDEEVTT